MAWSFYVAALAAAFPAVSYALVVGSRSVLVLVGPRGGFVCLNVGSRLVLVFFPSRLVLVCVRRWSVAACAAVSFLCVVGWLWSVALRIGFGRSARAVVSYRFFFCVVPSVGRPMPKLGNFRCELIAFKYPLVYRRRKGVGRPAGSVGRAPIQGGS